MSANKLDDPYLLQLTDDCLYEIYKFLPITDWCSLRQTCDRLRTISDYLFERQSKLSNLTPEIVYGSSEILYTVTDAKRLIQNFGQFITKISIDRLLFRQQEDPERLLPLLGRYCQTLRDLWLGEEITDLEPATIAECQSLFSNLHRLVISEEAFNLCWSYCISLKDLELTNLNEFQGYDLIHHFKSLEHFTIRATLFIVSKNVGLFLMKNAQLKKVKLLRFESKRPNWLIVGTRGQEIVVQMPHLEELSLNCDFIVQPSMMPSLKRLEIDSSDVVDIKKFFCNLVAHNKIEDLHITAALLTDEFIQHLCAMKTLKILKISLSDHLDGDKCKKLALSLPSLSEIHILECNKPNFISVKEFGVHSTTLKRIIYYCPNRSLHPSLTKETFLLLANARLCIIGTLFVFLDEFDLTEIRNIFESDGEIKLLDQQINVIKLLPLQNEHKRAFVDFCDDTLL